MATRNVVLTDPLEHLIDRLLESGRYQNASEIMRAGLRLLEDHEAQTADVRAGVLEGLAQAKRGELVDGETAVRQAYDAALKKTKKNQ